MTDSMTRYETTFESTENLIRQIVLGHGENADLVAGITDNGTEVDLTGYTARAIYQPRSKWDSDDWYECPCDISGNKAVAHWGNTYDNGDNAVRMFIHLSKDGKVAYPALYKMRLFDTPGFTPSAITPIPETIDFSQYTLVNAPWVPIAGGVTLGGDLSTTHNLVHVATRTVTYKNLKVTDDTEAYYEQELVLSYDATDAAKLTQVGTDEVPIRISGVRVSTGEPEVTDCVLVNPAESNSHVTWDVLEASTRTSIGYFTFGLDGNVPGVVGGELHRDYIMASYSYAADTTEQVTDRLNYIYDGSAYAPKSEVTVLSTAVGSLSGTVGTLSGTVSGLSNQVSQQGTTVTWLWNHRHYVTDQTEVTQNNQLVQLEPDKVKGLVVPASSVAGTVLFALPTSDEGFVLDFVVDIDNRKQTAVTVDLNGDEFTIYWFAVDDGETLADILTIEGDKISRLYFTLLGIARDAVEDMPVPVLHVSKKVLAIGGHSEGEWPE